MRNEQSLSLPLIYIYTSRFLLIQFEDLKTIFLRYVQSRLRFVVFIF